MGSSWLSNGLEKIKQLVRGEPIATPPPDAVSGRLGDPDRETSTNAQAEGASEEPWSGNR
jgi:hypothetical protein